jgi:hypothetical protein
VHFGAPFRVCVARARGVTFEDDGSVQDVSACRQVQESGGILLEVEGCQLREVVDGCCDGLIFEGYDGGRGRCGDGCVVGRGGGYCAGEGGCLLGLAGCRRSVVSNCTETHR